MADKPWNSARRPPFWTVFNPVRAAASLGIVLLLVLGVSLLSPSWNTLAQRFTQFFLPSPSSQAEGAITPLETSHPRERFNLSISQAEALAGLKIKRFSEVPQGFHLVGALYDELREAIILHYTTSSGGLVLRFSQQRLDSDYQAIGPQAVVQMVSVGPYSAEFVSGGWMIPDVESGADATVSPFAPQTVWDANVSLQTLRWTDGEFLYEIILAGGLEQAGYLDKEGLIDLASQLD
jgi:hypothetical protein